MPAIVAAPGAIFPAVHVETHLGVEAEARIVARPLDLMLGAEPADHRRPVDRGQRHEVDRAHAAVDALGRTARAAVETGIAEHADRLDRPYPRHDMVAHVAKRVDDVRPFVGRRDLERFGPAAPPVARGPEQLPGRRDEGDPARLEIAVELADCSGPPRPHRDPRPVARLVLPAFDIVGRGIPDRWRRDRPDDRRHRRWGRDRHRLGRRGGGQQGGRQCCHEHPHQPNITHRCLKRH